MNKIHLSFSPRERVFQFICPEGAIKFKLEKTSFSTKANLLTAIKYYQEGSLSFDGLYSQIKNVRPYKTFFVIDGDGEIYLKNSHVPLPAFMVGWLEEELASEEALVRFWTNSLLNPDPVARNSFCEYVGTHGISITEEGYALLYKAVTNRKGNTEFFNWVTGEIVRIRKMKKGLSRYYVWECISDAGCDWISSTSDDIDTLPFRGEYYNLKCIGNLGDIVRDMIDNEDDEAYPWTDKHTRKMKIGLGKECIQDRDKCNSDPSVGCSHGLHVGSFDYVLRFADPEDPILLCMVNPRNVVAVPNHDNSKMRVCAYMPVGLLGKGTFSKFEDFVFDVDYIKVEKGLTEAYQSTFGSDMKSFFLEISK